MKKKNDLLPFMRVPAFRSQYASSAHLPLISRSTGAIIKMNPRASPRPPRIRSGRSADSDLEDAK